MNLKNKSIVITGASSGIGKELALQMAAKGARVALGARNAAALKAVADQVQALGGQAVWAATDVRERAQVEALVKKAVQAFGRVDIFVANAGISISSNGIMDSQEADVRTIMDTNYMGPLYGVWAAVPEMEKTGGGQIVFVSSVVGKRGMPRSGPYCASKFAVQGLTESIRPELARKNIRVITVCPPGVDTPFFENSGRRDRGGFRLHPVEKIAGLIVKACERETREALLTIDTKILHWGNVLLPRFMDWAVAKNKGV